MIDVPLQTIDQGEGTTKIVRWEVWWQTPFGATKDLEGAYNRVVGADLEPKTFIKPVPVAIGESGEYEVYAH